MFFVDLLSERVLSLIDFSSFLLLSSLAPVPVRLVLIVDFSCLTCGVFLGALRDAFIFELVVFFVLLSLRASFAYGLFCLGVFVLCFRGSLGVAVGC